MLFAEIVILCALFFIICILGTGTDHKNLKNYESYPDEVQKRIKEIKEYQGSFREKSKLVTWIVNFLIFSIIFLIFGRFICQKNFIQNFILLFILGQTINIFDLVVIDLLWWRNTKRIRLLKIPEKELYQNPEKHITSFLRAFVMYFFIALIDGYILTLF